jgi:hypothetical protein
MNATEHEELRNLGTGTCEEIATADCGEVCRLRWYERAYDASSSTCID